jgi:hypothetical protein
MEGKRERRVVLARGTESRNGRAATPGPLKWANFIEILIGVVSTDLNHRGASPHARDLLHWFATPMQQIARSYACGFGASTQMRTIRINITDI